MIQKEKEAHEASNTQMSCSDLSLEGGVKVDQEWVPFRVSSDKYSFL